TIYGHAHGSVEILQKPLVQTDQGYVNKDGTYIPPMPGVAQTADGSGSGTDTSLQVVTDERELGVALPPGWERVYSVSALEVADQTLSSLGRNGIMDKNTNC